MLLVPPLCSPGICLQQDTDVESSSYLLGKQEILLAVKEEELQLSGSCIYSSWTLPENSSCTVTVGVAVTLMGGMLCLPKPTTLLYSPSF